MINLRVAEVLAYEILGTKWEAECLTRGFNPSTASADDVLGPIPVSGMWDASGSRVLLYQDDPEVFEAAQEDQVKPESPRAFVKEVAQIAGLTRSEGQLVYAIIDGAPIPDGKAYTGPLTRRFRTTPVAIRKRWSNAKRKIRDNWAGE